MSLVQVGTQNNSRLKWAFGCGALEDAEAMIMDHLTIRNHRDHYFFGTNEFLSRHTDNVRTLTGNAPTLLPPLFDGLMWRTRPNQDSLRRVYYYIRPLRIMQDGKFAATIKNPHPS